MKKFQLAELNIAQMKAPIDSPVMKDFVDNLDRINGLAEQSPGFVWRLQMEDGNATSLRPFGDDIIVNLSVWEDKASLFDYVYGPGHVEIMRRKKEWFDRMSAAYLVLWWVPAGHQPSEEEAKEKLMLLREVGPTAAAFTFKQFFPSPENTD